MFGRGGGGRKMNGRRERLRQLWTLDVTAVCVVLDDWLSL